MREISCGNEDSMASEVISLQEFSKSQTSFPFTNRSLRHDSVDPALTNNVNVLAIKQIRKSLILRKSKRTHFHGNHIGLQKHFALSDATANNSEVQLKIKIGARGPRTFTKESMETHF